MRRRRILIVGSGAREHALAWKLIQSPEVECLLFAPGNAGTMALGRNVPVAATDIDGIVSLVDEQEIDLTVVGPEAPLALGLVDRLRTIGRRVVGPSAAAARIESSKAFAKMVMRRAGVPTARYAVFDDARQALAYLQDASLPLVVKADGLAAGKGVTVCAEREEAYAAIRAAMVEGAFGSSGRRVVVEEKLEGPEVSLLALVDGKQVVALPLVQDHKRLGEGDTGPNTGGMGAYAPVPFVDRLERGRLAAQLLEPVVAVLADMGTPYRGVLFAGLMLTADGPRVLEYNCRLGDPETQVIMPLLVDDLLPWLDAVSEEDATALPARAAMPVRDGAAVGVVLAVPGYPEQPRLGAPIEGLDTLPPDVLAFHGGTARDEAGRVVTSGGRVLTVVGTGETVERAAQRAYAAPIRFPDMQQRKDIAWQARAAARSEITTSRGTIAGAARILVFASGEGSNLQALIEACGRGEVDGKIIGVVSHAAEAHALRRAMDAGIEAISLLVTGPRDPLARHRLEEDLLGVVRHLQPDIIVLAGWMLVLSQLFLSDCPCPILNVHPALLPGDPTQFEPLPENFPVLRGLRAVRRAVALGLPYTGVSVHHVTPEVDAGPLIARQTVPIQPDDDEDSLYRRIKRVEHQILPIAIQTVIQSGQFPGGIHARDRHLLADPAC